MAWLMGECVVRYVGECVRACRRMACYFVCLGSSVVCVSSATKSVGSGTIRRCHSRARIQYQSNARLE